MSRVVCHLRCPTWLWTYGRSFPPCKHGDERSAERVWRDGYGHRHESFRSANLVSDRGQVLQPAAGVEARTVRDRRWHAFVTRRPATAESAWSGLALGPESGRAFSSMGGEPRRSCRRQSGCRRARWSRRCPATPPTRWRSASSSTRRCCAASIGAPDGEVTVTTRDMRRSRTPP